MRSLLAIANAEAGSTTDEAVEAAIATLRGSYDVTVARTSTPDDLASALARPHDLDAIAVLGGDGSLHAVVDALHAAGRLADVTVGLVPLGTGNDFAATLDIPADDPGLAVDLIVRGFTRQVDVIVDGDDTVVVNAAHIGIGADAAAAARPWKGLLGPVGYVVGAVLTSVKGLTTPGARLEIRIDDETLPRKRPVIQLAVGNGRFVGGGTELLPKADPFDGRLDVAVVYTSSRRRRIAYAWRVRRGDHHQHEDVVYLQGASVDVHGDPLASTSDGELSPASPRHSWRIEPGALRMFVA
jgi:YegS/Rv2252/BmrU family lipid kinase